MKVFGRSADDNKQTASSALREARRFLPSSAKSPDAQRLELFNSDEELDETDDQDLAFLVSLVADVPAQDAPLARQSAPDVSSEPPADDLEVFRELAAMRQRSEVARHLRVGDVDMGDLLDDLQTTRAALRRLKAA